MLLEECTVCEECSGEGGTIYGWGRAKEGSLLLLPLGLTFLPWVATPVLGLGPVAG